MMTLGASDKNFAHFVDPRTCRASTSCGSNIAVTPLHPY
jgi:hypothetical protein